MAVEAPDRLHFTGNGEADELLGGLDSDQPEELISSALRMARR